MKPFYLSFVFCLYEIPTIAIMDEMGHKESCGLYIIYLVVCMINTD